MLKFFPLIGAILLSAAPAIGHQSDDIYVLCRAVMDERPRDPSDNKEVNANGNSFYPPFRDQSDPNAFGKEYAWKVLKCGMQPGIYDAEPRHESFY